MKRTTVFLDEEVEKDLQALATSRNLPTAALVREALSRYVEAEKKARAKSLSIVAVGRSGCTDTAEKHEDLLWAGSQPHGKSARRAPGPGSRLRRRNA